MSKYDLDFSVIFKYDNTSPTFLRWVIPRKGRGGKPVARRNNGVAGNYTLCGGVSVNIEGSVYSNKYVVWVLHGNEIPTVGDVMPIDGNIQNLAIENLEVRVPVETDDKYSSYLSEYFVYDETSPSCLRWVKKSASGSTIKAGDIAGSQDLSNGYWRVHALNSSLKAHKIIWQLLKGTCQDDMTVDHEDGNRGNNLISNLRLVPNEINQRNRCINKNNSTGITGVSYSENSKGFSKYTSTYYNGGTKYSKAFSVQKWGAEEALRLATEWRENMIAALNAEGAGYTERHGT